jgi:glycosyltransferase involved in cell wall biosynthesis
VHPVVQQPELTGIPVIHVTRFNAMAWDCGEARTEVVDHGIADPGHLYTGADPSVAVVVNEPVRRWRVAGTDLVMDFARDLPVHVYGMRTELLRDAAAEQGVDGFAGLHDLPQGELHRQLARHRVYFHPYRWTSLGLSLLESMTIGMPVLALSTTEAPAAVPPEAGLVSNDVAALRRTAQRWLADPDEARERGQAAREHAMAHYGLERFLTEWDLILKEVAR